MRFVYLYIYNRIHLVGPSYTFLFTNTVRYHPLSINVSVRKNFTFASILGHQRSTMRLARESLVSTIFVSFPRRFRNVIRFLRFCQPRGLINTFDSRPLLCVVRDTAQSPARTSDFTIRATGERYVPRKI